MACFSPSVKSMFDPTWCQNRFVPPASPSFGVTRFHEWPAEALYSVAKQQITGQSVELPNLEGALKMFGKPSDLLVGWLGWDKVWWDGMGGS